MAHNPASSCAGDTERATAPEIQGGTAGPALYLSLSDIFVQEMAHRQLTPPALVADVHFVVNHHETTCSPD
jgi:hypothetical protein